MNKVRLGFVPAHREPFDENWASDMRKRCLDAFRNSNELEIIVPDESVTRHGCVWDDADAEKVISLFKDNDIDGLVIGTMTFGDEVAALTIASAFNDKPVFLFGTKEGPFTEDGNRKSDSFCGTLSISSGLIRRKIPFLFGGILFPEEDVFLSGIKNFARICTIIKGFIGAHIGQVGPRPERFETCIFSEDELMRKFRQRVIPIALPDIFAVATATENQAAVKSLVGEITKAADTSALKESTLTKIAGLEFALRKFADDKHLAGMGVQCWNAMQSVYGLSPCHAMARLTDSGVMTACEVDIYGVLTMLLQYLAAMKSTVPHFIDWTIQHQEKDNVFLAWHCGNGPSSLACENCKPELSYQSVLWKTLGVENSMGTAEFQVKPGVVTLNRFQEHDGVFKLLIARGTINSTRDKLRGTWSWVEVPNLDKLYATLVNEGFTHHGSLIHGDYVKPMADACKFLGIEPVVV